MPVEVAGVSDDKGRRPNAGFLVSRARFAASILLSCLMTFPALAAREDGRVVRQEAPFPTIYDSAVVPGGAPARYEVLRGDFHMHTIHSDGSLLPADRVMEAWRFGYDVIAITDHGNVRAYGEALPTAKALGILLLRGVETSLSGQEHLVVLGYSAGYEARSPQQWTVTPGQAFYQDELRRVAAAGGIVLYAHPHVGLREPVLWGIGQGLIQGIEVKNDVVGSGWNTLESLGTYWYPFGFDWGVEHNLALFANSDVHGARADVPQATTLILAEERSPEAVMAAFRAGRTLAYFNNMLCSHEWVLKLLMGSLVEVQLTEMDDGRAFLRLQNRGPVELTAQLTGMPLVPVTLGPYQKVLVAIRRIPDAVTITWKNLYVNSTKNLTTTHDLLATGEQNQSSNQPSHDR